MQGSAYDFHVRVLSCQSCGAPLEVGVEGGAVKCSYCGSQLMIERREAGRIVAPHTTSDEQARLAKLRMQVALPLEQNPYATLRPPPGYEALVFGGRADVQETLALRWREALALVRREPSFDVQRVVFWCAAMLNQGYGLSGKHLERRAVLESSAEVLQDPGFRQLLYTDLASASARFGDFDSARAWLSQCDPRSEDIMLDSAYRLSAATLDIRGGDFEAGLKIIGTRAEDFPVSAQHRLLIGAYRIHALEQLGRMAEATTAANEALAEPEFGGHLLMVLEKNELAPATAATLASSAQTPLAARLQLAQAQGGGIQTRHIVMLVLGIFAVVFGTIGVIVYRVLSQNF